MNIITKIKAYESSESIQFEILDLPKVHISVYHWELLIIITYEYVVDFIGNSMIVVELRTRKGIKSILYYDIGEIFSL